MPQIQSSHTQIRKFLPFLLIFLAVIIWMERQRSGSSPPPRLTLISQSERSSENTDFALSDLSGNSIELSELRGKVVLLNFFETWCPPCREEMPTLETLYQTYKEQNFVVLGVAGDASGKKLVEPFVREYGLTFPILLDTQKQVSQQYRIRSIPTVYLLDQHGKIAGMTVGGADWNSREAKELIEQLLQES